MLEKLKPQKWGVFLWGSLNVIVVYGSVLRYKTLVINKYKIFHKSILICIIGSHK